MPPNPASFLKSRLVLFFSHPQCCTSAAHPPLPMTDTCRHLHSHPMVLSMCHGGSHHPRVAPGRGGVGHMLETGLGASPLSAFPTFPAHLCRCCSAGVYHCTRPPCCRHASWENRGDNSQASGISTCCWPQTAPCQQHSMSRGILLLPLATWVPIPPSYPPLICT